MRIFTAALVACMLSGRAIAWGERGHKLTGMLAMNLLSSEAKDALKDLLPGAKGDITAVSTWADRVKYLERYSNTRTLHYSDSQDTAPNSCTYYLSRDCPDGQCLTAAIGAFSNAVRSRNPQVPAHSGPPFSVEESLKFLVHFGIDEGGNKAPAVFDHRRTNLHAVWDSKILDKYLTFQFQGSLRKLADDLLKGLIGEFAPEVPEWTVCQVHLQPSELTFDLGNRVGEGEQMVLHGREKEVICPAHWAWDSNILNCESVWKDYDPTVDLGTKYYNNSIPVVRKAILKGAVRLAAVLEDVIVRKHDT